MCISPAIFFRLSGDYTTPFYCAADRSYQSACGLGAFLLRALHNIMVAFVSHWPAQSPCLKILSSQDDNGELLYCRMTVDNRPMPGVPLYRVRDVEMRIGKLEDPLSSELYSFRSGRSLSSGVSFFCASSSRLHWRWAPDSMWLHSWLCHLDHPAETSATLLKCLKV